MLYWHRQHRLHSLRRSLQQRQSKEEKVAQSLRRQRPPVMGAAAAAAAAAIAMTLWERAVRGAGVPIARG